MKSNLVPNHDMRWIHNTIFEFKSKEYKNNVSIKMYSLLSFLEGLYLVKLSHAEEKKLIQKDIQKFHKDCIRR